MRVQEGRHGRPRTTSTMATFSHFKPTRGNMLMVFSHLDEDQNGIVTESEFVGSMVELGCTAEEAQGYFSRYNASCTMSCFRGRCHDLPMRETIVDSWKASFRP